MPNRVFPRRFSSSLIVHASGGEPLAGTCRAVPKCVTRRLLQECATMLTTVTLLGCHEISPFDGHQYAPAGGERKAAQAHGEPAWLDSQRCKRAPGGGGPAPGGICIH